MVLQYKRYYLGDICALFYTYEGITSFTLVPKGTEHLVSDFKLSGEDPFKIIKMEPCVQLAFEGDSFSRDFSRGQSMKNTATAYSFRLVKQEEIKEKNGKMLVSTFKNSEGLIFKQYLRYVNGYHVIEMHNEVINGSKERKLLQMIASFTVNNLSPYDDYNDPDKMIVHEMRTDWSTEGKLISTTASDLLLEPSWSGLGIRLHRFGQVGSMPARNHLPFVALEDKSNGIVWAAQIEAPDSWHIEITHRNNGIHLSGGRGDFLGAHWQKTLEPGTSFKTNKAFVTVVKGELLDATNAIVDYFKTRVKCPASELNIPVIYNEYCYSWGTPTMEKAIPLLKMCKDIGASYFVVDAGWAKDDKIGWMDVGDWITYDKAFPHGLKELSDLAKSYGIRLGIWYEFEGVSTRSYVYKEYPEYLLRANGKIIHNNDRAFLDFRNPDVIKYLDERVLKNLKDNNIGYIKIDYNENFGIGCDSKDGLGEGLREQIALVLAYSEKLTTAIPDLVLEVCSSGGMRHEPLFISKGSMISFSDAHTCPSGSIISSNLHRFMLPRQMQIWATIEDDYDAEDVNFTIVKAMLGRYCLSGNIATKTDEVKGIISDSIKFYEYLKPIILHGCTTEINDKEITSYNYMKGYHHLIRKYKDRLAIYVFSVGELERHHEIKLDGDYELEHVFNTSSTPLIKKQTLLFKTLGVRQYGACFILKKGHGK
ncbi:MAG: glycoside hydrolase family 36 protein [Bacilli bacterium]|jgi:alpha-galactosidase